jgi:hypothetical protein
MLPPAKIATARMPGAQHNLRRRAVKVDAELDAEPYKD